MKKSESIISCRNVSMGYEGKTVLQNLSFDISSGDYLCVVGENGSGKTTLIKGLLGLCNPQKGHIEFGAGLQKNHIGYLPQQTAIQRSFPGSVYEIVLSGCLNFGLSPFFSKKQKQEAIKNMEKCGISDIKNKCYRELSGGQQQKVLLARALCAAQKLIILDEPVTGLDPMASGEMYSIITELNKSGLTVVMISHDITAAVNRAGKILHIEKENPFFGTTHQYIHSELGQRFLFKGCHCENCTLRNN